MSEGVGGVGGVCRGVKGDMGGAIAGIDLAGDAQGVFSANQVEIGIGKRIMATQQGWREAMMLIGGQGGIDGCLLTKMHRTDSHDSGLVGGWEIL